MPVGIGGAGQCGIAMEATPGTYLAPTKFFPILGETLDFNPGITFRRPIRQTVDQIGAIPGNVSISGTLTMECMEDVLIYFLDCMRFSLVKTGSSPNFIWTATPISVSAQAVRTMSITVVRNAQVFGYVGCVISKLTLAIQNDILQMDADVLGLNEVIQPPSTPAVPASTVNVTNSNVFPVSVTITGGTITAVLVNSIQVGTTAGTYTVPAGQTISITYSSAPTWSWVAAIPVPTFTTTAPFSPGMWNVQIPTSTQVFDMDTFSFSVEEAGTAQYRLKNTGANAGRGAQLIALGERTVQMTATRDFLNRNDFNSFEATALQSNTIIATKGVNNQITILTGNVAMTVYQVPMPVQGDIVKANITYDTTLDASGNACVITVATQENPTVNFP